ncbi:hypothetical protein [Neisseria shayeganii]|uniref:Uncharacterized protein n=1 Tax=Neisseria shayeganii TaxID=607712 RepID=A0A7D7N5V2_9NEIS|nr:hypothetical protein [Neisseria shayeganii]QMT40880.1 hypothetical protein H3L94_02145 [Neisseria shayeganii]
MFIKIESLSDIASRKQYFGKNLAEVFISHWVENFDSEKFLDNVAYYLNRYVNGKYYVFFPDNSYFICSHDSQGFHFKMACIIEPSDFSAIFYADGFPPSEHDSENVNS